MIEGTLLAPEVAVCPARVGQHSPWGSLDYVETIADGIATVGTPSHGGIKLSRERNAAVPEYMREEGGWYEEDCDWVIPFIVFEADIREFGEEYAVKSLDKKSHIDTFKNWHPDSYERWFGITLQPGESYLRDQRLFYEAHKNDWIVESACGDHDERVPKGHVAVYAAIGGRKNTWEYPKDGRWFLVTAEEYKNDKGKHGFVVDPAKHKEIPAMENSNAQA